MQIETIAAFLSGVALVALALLLKAKIRCRGCHELGTQLAHAHGQFSVATQALEDKLTAAREALVMQMEEVRKNAERVHVTNERLLLAAGIPALPEPMSEEQRLAEAAREKEEVERTERGGRTYGV